MERCSCWRTFVREGKRADERIQYCVGAKENEWCHCNGDKSKCDFYDYIRKEASKMNTAEMWLKAQEDGKTYRLKYADVAYQKDRDLFDIDTGVEIFCNDAMNDRSKLTDLLDNEWVEVEALIMTKSEAEAKFNIKIVG